MVTWLLEKNVFSEDCFDRMVAFFEKDNIPYHLIKIIPFTDGKGIIFEGSLDNITGPVVCYGSIGIQKVAIRWKYNPGIWTSDKFDETNVRDTLGELYLNNDAITVPFEDVLSHIELDEFFIKPNGDTKEFTGQVIKANEFVKWRNDLISIGYLDNNNFDVVVSAPKEIGAEFRLVVVNNNLVTWSRYGSKSINNNLPGKALELFIKASMKFRPADVYVMDIADTPNGWKVIEYNIFNSADLYNCNVEKIISKINTFLEEGETE